MSDADFIRKESQWKKLRKYAPKQEKCLRIENGHRTLDLHGFEEKEAAQVIEEFIELLNQKNIKAGRIIYGQGEVIKRLVLSTVCEQWPSLPEPGHVTVFLTNLSDEKPENMFYEDSAPNVNLGDLLAAKLDAAQEAKTEPTETVEQVSAAVEVDSGIDEHVSTVEEKPTQAARENLHQRLQRKCLSIGAGLFNKATKNLFRKKSKPS